MSDESEATLVSVSLPAAAIAALNEWRRRQPDPPSKSRAVRILAMQALSVQEPAMSDAHHIRSLRVEIAHWGRIMTDPEKPSWQVAHAGRQVLKLQLERQQLDGTEPSVELEEIERYEAATQAATERVLRNEVPPICGPGARGNFRPFVVQGETELVSTPESQAIAARRANRTSIFASPPAIPLGGTDGGGGGPMAWASPTGDLHGCSDVVPRTGFTPLSGATE
jgi:hypothetical protein